MPILHQEPEPNKKGPASKHWLSLPVISSFSHTVFQFTVLCQYLANKTYLNVLKVLKDVKHLPIFYLLEYKEACQPASGGTELLASYGAAEGSDCQTIPVNNCRYGY